MAHGGIQSQNDVGNNDICHTVDKAITKHKPRNNMALSSILSQESTCMTSYRGHSVTSYRGRSVTSYRGRAVTSNAARERSRVQTLRSAFEELQKRLPSVPADTKLSKLDILLLATTYIKHLTDTLDGHDTKPLESSEIKYSQRDLAHPTKVRAIIILSKSM